MRPPDVGGRKYRYRDSFPIPGCRISLSGQAYLMTLMLAYLLL